MQRIWRIVRGKPILTLVVAATVFAGVFAFAATLGVSSNTLGAGGDAVVSCDPDGVTVSYDTVYDAALAPKEGQGPTPAVPAQGGYKVTDVTIAGIAAACDGAEMKVVLTGPGTSMDILNVVSDEFVRDIDATVVDADNNTTEVLQFGASDIAAADVTGVSVVIQGVDLT